MKKTLLSLFALLGIGFCSFAQDVYIVAGSEVSLFGTSWDAGNTANTMADQGGGIFAKTYNAPSAMKDIQFKVVKNGSEWIGDENGNNVTFNMKSAGDFTISINTSNNAISVTGDNVSFDTDLEYDYVCAVGNGSGVWLNGIAWNPAEESNKMTEIAPDIWEILYKDVPESSSLQVKFALDGSWAKNFGGSFSASGEVTPAVWDGGNITFNHPGGDIRLHLDLSNFDLKTKQGATFTISLGADASKSNFEVLDPVVQIGTYLKFEARNANNNYRYVLDSYEWHADKGPQLQLAIEPLDPSKPAAFTADDLADLNYWEPLFRKYTAMIAGEEMSASENIHKLFIDNVAILPNQFAGYPDALKEISVTASGDYEFPNKCFFSTDKFNIEKFDCKVEGEVTIGIDVFPPQKSGKMTIYCAKESIAQAWYSYKVAHLQGFTVFLNGEKYEGDGVELTEADASKGNGVRYNVMGQRVGNDYRGMVIVDGKKLFVR